MPSCSRTGTFGCMTAHNTTTQNETERLKRKFKAQQPPLRQCAKCDKPALGWTAGGPEQDVFLSCEDHWGTESPKTP